MNIIKKNYIKFYENKKLTKREKEIKKIFKKYADDTNKIIKKNESNTKNLLINYFNNEINEINKTKEKKGGWNLNFLSNWNPIPYLLDNGKRLFYWILYLFDTYYMSKFTSKNFGYAILILILINLTIILYNFKKYI